MLRTDYMCMCMIFKISIVIKICRSKLFPSPKQLCLLNETQFDQDGKKKKMLINLIVRNE